MYNMIQVSDIGPSWPSCLPLLSFPLKKYILYMYIVYTTVPYKQGYCFNIFSYFSTKTYVVVLIRSTHYLCFYGEIRKMSTFFIQKSTLSVAMSCQHSHLPSAEGCLPPKVCLVSSKLKRVSKCCYTLGIQK